MFLAIITIYVIVLQVLKVIYLLFKPKFLNPVRFGPPSKYMLLAYYIIVIFVLLLFTLEKLNILKIEITQISDVPKIQSPFDRNFLIVIIIGLIAGTIHTVIEYYIRKKKRKVE
ncbi:MAG TPA: hypothetical protein VHD35_01875 [Chitinophagaceae bacterium]|jgi:hypothetical protein|nr:hypothetical protein [Chitinophagaceae bacterium]